MGQSAGELMDESQLLSVAISSIEVIVSSSQISVPLQDLSSMFPVIHIIVMGHAYCGWHKVLAGYSWL